MRGRGVGGLISIQAKPLVVNLSSLEVAFAPGDTVTPKLLLERGLIRTRRGAHMPEVKIFGGGELTKKLTLSGMIVSGSAKEKIEKAGGSVAAKPLDAVGVNKTSWAISPKN